MKKHPLLGLVSILAMTFECSALVGHWSGAEDGFYTNANNWVEGVVPGRYLALNGEGQLVTNGVTGASVVFGDDLTGNRATTIDFDGVYSMTNLTVEATANRYTLGISAAQCIPIESRGMFNGGAREDVQVPTIVAWIGIGVGSDTTGYGTDFHNFRNDSAETLVLPMFHVTNRVMTMIVDGVPKAVTTANEFGLRFYGSGAMRLTKNYSTARVGNAGGGAPHIDVYSTGTLYLDATLPFRNFTYKNETSADNNKLRRMVVGANGNLNNVAGFYAALTTNGSLPVEISGEGVFTQGSGGNAGASYNPHVKSGMLSCFSRIEVSSRMALSESRPTGYENFVLGLWFTSGSGPLVLNVPEGGSTVKGRFRFTSSTANAVLELPRIGLRGTYGAHGDEDFSFCNNGILRYTGVGETTDRYIAITNQLAQNKDTAAAYPASGTLEQAGTGEWRVTSPVALEGPSSGTLTFKNDVAPDGVYAGTMAGNVSVVKTGTGRWKFDSDTGYTGSTTVSAGTLYITKGGSIAASSGVSLAAGAQLVFEGDEAPLVQSCPALTVAGVGTKIVVGRGCTVTFADIAQTSGGTLDIVTEDDAAVKIAGKTGDAPNYITINGRKAAFDAEGKVKKYTVSVSETIDVHGGVIRNGAAGVGIVDGGDLGDVTLSQDATTVSAVVQQANEDATVVVADNQTLTAATLAIDEGKKDLALMGIGSFAAASGAFLVWPESEDQTISIATKTLDMSKATSFTKDGFGTARFMGEFNYEGPLAVNVGELAVTKSSGAPSVTLSGAGTFAKEGVGNWQVGGDSSAFAGDYVVRGGTVEPATKDAYKSFGSTGNLVVTNGATLKIFDSAGGVVNYQQKHLHVSDCGEAPALEINSGKNLAYPFHDLTLDGDATITGTDNANPNKDFYFVSQQQGAGPTVDLANHTFTKTGYGRLGFRDVSFLSPGVIDVQTTANFTNCGSCNMLFLCGTITGPEEGRVKARMGDGTMLVLSGTTQPIPLDVDIVSGNVYMGVWSANDRNLAHQNLGGTIDLKSADSMLALSGYGDSTRWLNFTGPITGAGGVKTVNNYGKYYFGGTNTYTGETTFAFPTGSGGYGAVTYASWQALPGDFSKASFTYLGSVNLRLSGDGGVDTAWPLAKVGELMRTASIKNNCYAALDLGETGDFAMNISDLGASPASGFETGFGRNGHWADDYALTINLDEDWGSDSLRVCCHNGILRFQCPNGNHILNCYLMRISGEGNSSTGRLEVVDGAEVRVGNGLTVGANDSSLAQVTVRNATLAGPTGWGSQPVINLGGVTYSRGICDLEEGARVNAQLVLGNGANAYGGALFQKGGLWYQNANTTQIGSYSSGYWEMIGGEAVFSNCTVNVARGTTNTVGLIRQTGGRIVMGGTTQLLGPGGDGHAHFLMTGGEFVSEGTQGRITEWPYSSTTAHDSDAVLTLDGATAHFRSSDSKSLFLANQTNGLAIVNLKAGTLEVGDITACASKYPGSAAYVNFNGGTLKANKATTDWVKGVTRTEVGPNGAVVDTAGFDATLKNAFVAPFGMGVTGVDWSTQKGIRVSLNKTINLWQKMALPYFVYIVGDGTGASAVMEFDRAAQQMTGIRIVSPGSGYTWAKAIITSGQSSSNTYGEHVEVTCTLGAVGESGNFTKKGAGTLTLTGANTYGGDTIVEGGLLKLGAANALPEGSEVKLAGGGITAAAGVALPETLTVTLTAAEIAANPKAKFVLLSCPEGLPATLPQIVFAEDGVPPKGWFVCKDGNQLVLRRVTGTAFYFR